MGTATTSVVAWTRLQVRPTSSCRRRAGLKRAGSRHAVARGSLPVPRIARRARSTRAADDYGELVKRARAGSMQVRAAVDRRARAPGPNDDTSSVGAGQSLCGRFPLFRRRRAEGTDHKAYGIVASARRDRCLFSAWNLARSPWKKKPMKHGVRLRAAGQLLGCSVLPLVDGWF